MSSEIVARRLYGFGADERTDSDSRDTHRVDTAYLAFASSKLVGFKAVFEAVQRMFEREESSCEGFTSGFIDVNKPGDKVIPIEHIAVAVRQNLERCVFTTAVSVWQ